MTQPGTSSAPVDPTLASDPPRDAATLGATLRQARERQGLELSDVAEVTHVRREYLAALEEGRYADLPEDVYARNFLRLYAQAVGLDHVDLLERYHRERSAALGAPAATEAAAAGSAGASATAPPPSRPRRDPPDLGAFVPTLLAVVLFVGVIAVGLWLFNSNLFTANRAPAPAAADAPVDAGAPAAPADAAPSGLAAPLEPAGDATGAAPTGTQPAAPASGSAAEGATGAAPREILLTISTTPPGARVMVDNFVLPGTTPIVAERITARDSRVVTITREGYDTFEQSFDMTTDRNLAVSLTPAGSAAAAAPSGSGEEGAAADAPATPDAPAASAASTGGPLGSGQVEIVVNGETWLEVYASNARGVGERLVYTTAQPGQRWVFSAPLFVRAGNAAGVQVRQGDAQAATLGSNGEVVNRTFTP